MCKLRQNNNNTRKNSTQLELETLKKRNFNKKCRAP